MANTKISDLTAGAAVSATDVLPNVQTTGVGPVKTTAAELKTFMSASPTLVTPNLGTPSAGTLTSCTGLPISTGVSGLGTGNATALAVNVGSSGAFVRNNAAETISGALTLTSATPQLTLGVNATTLGSVKLFGSTSGDVTLKVAAAAGTATVFQLPASNGTNGYFLQTDGNGVTSWVAGGGGVTIDSTAITSGTAGRVLFENASNQVSEDSGLTFDATNNALTVGGATVTTSNPVLNLSQTWNAGGVAFTGLKFNVTHTASAANSLYLDLQSGGASKFSVGSPSANGAATAIWVGVTPSGLSNAFAFTDASTATFIQDRGTGAGIHFSNAGNWGDVAVYPNAGNGTLRVGSTVQFGFSSTGSANNALDTILTRGGAAATLRQGAADAASPVAQTLTVQSVVAGTSNTAGVDWTIQGSRGTGTGAGGKIIFKTAPAGSTGTSQNAASSAWAIDSNLTLYPAASLATDMTAGFINIPGAAGAASGTPGNTTGFPMYYDSTNNKIYVYNGSWRSTAALT